MVKPTDRESVGEPATAGTSPSPCTRDPAPAEPAWIPHRECTQVHMECMRARTPIGGPATPQYTRQRHEGLNVVVLVLRGRVGHKRRPLCVAEPRLHVRLEPRAGAANQPVPPHLGSSLCEAEALRKVWVKTRSRPPAQHGGWRPWRRRRRNSIRDCRTRWRTLSSRV